MPLYSKILEFSYQPPEVDAERTEPLVGAGLLRQAVRPAHPEEYADKPTREEEGRSRHGADKGRRDKGRGAF